MYFAGEGISGISLEDRMTADQPCASGAGGKDGVCDVDEKDPALPSVSANLPNWTVYKD